MYKFISNTTTGFFRIIILGLSLFVGQLNGQNKLISHDSMLTRVTMDESEIDSLELELSVLEFIQFVQKSHPIVSASRLETNRGAAQLRKSRGSFDPRFLIQTNEKDAGQLPYYNRENIQLEIPTASPVKLESGFESGRGTFVNPELFTPQEGLSYAGVSIPLLKGMLTDERRTTLAKAKIFRNQSIEIQKIQLQDLSQTIWRDYVDWYIAHEQEKAYQLGMRLSLERQKALRQLFEAGGCNGMDTLENYIQLELFRTRAKEWNVNTYKQRLQLSRHLWEFSPENESWKSIIIAEHVSPTRSGLDFIDTLFLEIGKNEIVVAQLPDLKNLDWELQQKQLDLRLQRWNMLPTFDLKYQQLFGGVFGEYNLGTDRRFGLNISAPLFMRKERGDFQLSKIDFLQKSQMFEFKLNEADLKIRALYRQGLVYQDVYNHLKNVENGYLKLFELERQKFDSGDGTIFLLNTRENRYLNARIKTIEQKSKYIHTVLDYLRATGKISQSIFGTDGL